MTRLTLITAVAMLACACSEPKRHARAMDAAAATSDSRNASVSTDASAVRIDATSPMLAQIRLGVVETAEMPTDEVDAPGKIEANPNRLSHVVLPLPGRIAQVLVKIGDPVTRGQTVMLVESPDGDAAVATLAQAEGSVNIANSAVSKAEADAVRARDLFRSSAIPQKEVLAAESALSQARAALDSAKAVREEAENRVALLGLKPAQYGQKLAIKAPISGKVLDLNVAVNEYRSDTSASLMTIADLSDVWVSSDVPETSIRLVKPGESVGLELAAYPGEIFRARVLNLADTVDPVTHTVKVHAELPNPGGRLRPEMFGRIRHVNSVRPMPMVPLAALTQDEGRTYVYRVRAKGEFVPVFVEQGMRKGDKVSITGGIHPGDTIVTDGVMLLKGQS